MTRGWRRIGSASLILLGLLGVACALDFPALSGRVVDDAGILDTTAVNTITADLARLESRTRDQLVVATVKSLQGASIEEYANQLFRHWQLGQKETNNGVLLLIAPNERRARIEVGYGLEGSLTDATSRLIIENRVLPFFRSGDFSGGVKGGVDALVTLLVAAAEDRGEVVAPPSASRDRDDVWFLRFLLALMGLWALALIIQFATAIGLIPAKRKGFWRILDLIVYLASSVSASSSSSSGSSSGGGFSGGGGSSGGGGASGSW